MAREFEGVSREYTFFMFILTSITGALSLVSLIQKLLRIGIKPLLQEIIDFYRNIFHPIGDAIVWVLQSFVNLFPEDFVRAIASWTSWAWNGAWALFLGWWIYWVLPADFVDTVLKLYNSVIGMSRETYKDLFVLSFVLLLTRFRSNFYANEVDEFDNIYEVAAISGVAMPIGCLLLSIPLWGVWSFPFFLLSTAFATVFLGERESEHEYYIFSLVGIVAALVGFFALNSQL
jgi:hypothetical protein